MDVCTRARAILAVGAAGVAVVPAAEALPLVPAVLAAALFGPVLAHVAVQPARTRPAVWEEA